LLNKKYLNRDYWANKRRIIILYFTLYYKKIESGENGPKLFLIFLKENGQWKKMDPPKYTYICRYTVVTCPLQYSKFNLEYNKLGTSI